MEHIHEEFVFHRHPENPIVKPKDFPGAETIYNPGQTMLGDTTILLVSISHRSCVYRGVAGCTTHVARSRDGIHFDVDPEPFLQCTDEEPFATVDTHPIDTRVTHFPEDGCYYVLHPAGGPWGTLTVLGRTTDFTDYENIDIISLPDNRGASLFPEKINGKYVRVDRPYRVAPHHHHYLGNMWIAESPDMIHWGHHRPLLKHSDAGGWAGSKIGPTPPFKTEEGWLMIAHGVTDNCSGYRYRIGAVLMDLQDPTKIVGMTRSAILAPHMEYEYVGNCMNVVFVCGCIPDYEKRRVRMYYGCADTSIGLATADMDELIEACVKQL